MGCGEPDVACVGGLPTLKSGVRLPVMSNGIESVDLLVDVDDSGSMSENQRNLATSFRGFLDRLTNPPVDPATMRPQYAPMRSLHVGVVSSDLGTPGSVVPGCANSDAGDDGRLNPIRDGLATRAHQPWGSAPMDGRRPARCMNDPNQYPTFLTFDAATTNAAEFRDDFVCNAYLSIGGCGIEQQLESAYRALVIHDARERAGSTSPNAGFVRDNAILAILVVTDEEDGSTRDCRYAEQGVACTDAVSVFDVNSADWASPSDLNLRFYMYRPGSAQDPTWNLDRYIDRARPNRGFTSIKPGRPDLVIFSAIAGVPINLPMHAGTAEIDWDALLGAMPDGSDGYVGVSAEGPISMRQRNADPACTTRVVAACRREGSTMATTCDPAAQYFAWPSRRIAQVARRFAETYSTGTISSICKNDYGGALTQLADHIQQRLAGRCLSRPIQTVPAACPADTAAGPAGCVRINCVVREILAPGMTSRAACTAARGRTPGDPDAQTMRETCLIHQLVVPAGAAPAAGSEGFFYDTRRDASSGCMQRIELTANAGVAPGATAVIECAQTQTAHTTAAACAGTANVGESCTPQRPGEQPCNASTTSGCFQGTEIFLETGSRTCRSGVCLAYRYAEASDARGTERARRVYCSCRCGVPPSLQASVDPSTLCACPDGFTCQPDLAGPQYDPGIRGSYCVRTGTTP